MKTQELQIVEGDRSYTYFAKSDSIAVRAWDEATGKEGLGTIVWIPGRVFRALSIALVDD